MKRNQAFPSKYLSKEDITTPTVGIIHKVIIETLGQGEDQDTKPIMYFTSGISKPMAINNTNWMIVEALYGDESDDWTGKPIEVWVDPNVIFGKKVTGGLRLRAPSSTTRPVGNGGSTADLATGEQWEMYFSLASELEAKGLPITEPPDNITAQGLLKVMASMRAKLNPGGWIGNVPPKRSEAQVLTELGYEQAEPAPASQPGLTLEEASNMTNVDGVKYGEIETSKLAVMFNSLNKVKNRTPAQQQKWQAIQVILKGRELKAEAAA